MPESTHHTALVETIGEWVRREFSLHADGLYLLSDCPTSHKDRKPWRISGFVPDVFVGTCPASFTLLGEAKWFGDLETKHSGQQMRAFLAYLKGESDPHFVLATPFWLVATARGLLRRAAQDVGAGNVRLHVIGWSSSNGGLANNAR